MTISEFYVVEDMLRLRDLLWGVEEGQKGNRLHGVFMRALRKKRRRRC